MKFCEQCGHGNEDGATYCASCGAALATTGSGQPPMTPPTGPTGTGYRGYGAPQSAYAKPNESMAVASLVMGIGAFFVCPIVLGVLAIIFGNIGLRNIEESRGALGGDGFARAGIILGWINIGLCILVGVIILIIVLVAASSNSAVLGLVLPV